MPSDRPDMTSAVYRGRKASTQTKFCPQTVHFNRKLKIAGRVLWCRQPILDGRN